MLPGARDNYELTEIILKQNGPLEILLSLMEDYEDHEDLYGELHLIHDFLNDQEPPISGADLGRFAELIEGIRTEIVKL